MKRIMIYSHDTFGLGNIRRMLSIAEFIAAGREDYSILLITGSPMLHAFRISQKIDYIKLPSLQRDIEGNYAVRSLALSMDEIIAIRSNIILTTVEDYQPDILIVDKKPLGICAELQPAMEYLNRGENARHVRRLLLLRDILDSSEVTREIWKKRGYYDAIEQYYDRVLVVGQSEIFDLTKEYAFPPAAQKKLEYCGYIRREAGLKGRQVVRSELGLSDQHKLVFVTPGGGKDGFRLITNYLMGIDRYKNDSVYSLVLCGPEMLEEHVVTIKALAHGKSRCLIQSFTDDLMSYMAAADVVVSMFGYNTACEILTLGKPAVVVPRTHPVKEQWIRAERLAELGLVKIIHPEFLESESLYQAIDSLLFQGERLRMPEQQINLNALPVIKQIIADEIDIQNQLINLSTGVIKTLSCLDRQSMEFDQEPAGQSKPLTPDLPLQSSQIEEKEL